MDERRSIGQLLRHRREERGLTLEQAAAQSKVPLRLLQALEADDYRVLPDPGYLIRFLYEYALLLKLDPAPLEEQFRASIRRPPKAGYAPPPPPAPSPAIPWRQVLWTLGAILVMIPLVFIVLSLASKRAADRPAPVRTADQTQEEARPPQRLDAPAEADRELLERSLALRPAAPPPGGSLSTEQLIAPAAKGSPGTEGSAPPLSPARTGPETLPSPASGPPRERPESSGPGLTESPLMAPTGSGKAPRFLLTARALEPAWMAVRADGGQVREVLLQKGQTARFSAERGFLVTLGNAGGVDIQLNGERIPSLGASGQVIRDLALPPARPPRDPD